MRIAAISVALLFFGSPVLERVCLLSCATRRAAVAAAAESHCGEKPVSPRGTDGPPCRENHRSETLVCIGASKGLPVPVLSDAGSPSTLPSPRAMAGALPAPVFESPPPRHPAAVLRL